MRKQNGQKWDFFQIPLGEKIGENRSMNAQKYVIGLSKGEQPLNKVQRAEVVKHQKLDPLENYSTTVYMSVYFYTVDSLAKY